MVTVPSLRRSLFARIKGGSDSLVFAVIVVMVGSVTTFDFLWRSGVNCSRFRLPLMSAATLSMQVVYTTLRKNIGLSVVNLVGSGLAAAAFIPSSYHLSELRRTNCDLAAVVVANSAAQDDLVIVNRFTHAPTFQRYYRGTAPWTSVPEVGEHLQHRAYLARSVMLNPDAIQDILLRIESEVQAGHKCVLVGRFLLYEMSRPLSHTPPPQAGASWMLGTY